jgi:hypothetical protein
MAGRVRCTAIQAARVFAAQRTVAVAGRAAVGVSGLLAAGVAGVAGRSSYPRRALGVHHDAGLVVRTDRLPVEERTKHQALDSIPEVGRGAAMYHLEDHGVDARRLVVDVLDGDLHAAVWSQPRHLGGANQLVQAAGDAVGHPHRQRHQLRRLGAGVPEDRRLLAGRQVIGIVAVTRPGRRHHAALGQNGATFGIEIAAVVAGLQERAAYHAVDVHLAVQAGVGRDEDDLAGGGSLGTDQGARVHGQMGVHQGIGDAVTELIRMAAQHRVRGEEAALGHSLPPMIGSAVVG